MADEQKFPSEIIDLPSEGKLYSKDSPLKDGKIEIKNMKLVTDYRQASVSESK